MTALTAAQERMLAEVREAGERNYNGRARRQVEALEAAGLVEYDYELRPATIGKWTELFTVRPTTNGDGMARNEQRAERGKRAIKLHPDYTATDVTTPATDIVADILHGLEAMGAIDPADGRTAEMVLGRALRTYEGDAEDDETARPRRNSAYRQDAAAVRKVRLHGQRGCDHCGEPAAFVVYYDDNSYEDVCPGHVPESVR